MSDQGAASGRSIDLPEIHPSTTTISTVAIQAGRAKIVLAILRSHDWIRVKIQTMEPDLMEVGTSLEEALQLKKELEELCIKLTQKQQQITELLSKADDLATQQQTGGEVYHAMAESLGEAWKDLNAQLDLRRMLLDQSIAFHQSAKDFGDRMEKAAGYFGKVSLAQDVVSAKRLLQQHRDIKKGILEASKLTLEQGQALLNRIREMGMHADLQNRHATTAACYGIEHLLELLHDRRRHLEELWLQRKIKLEQCLQLCQLDQEVQKLSDWYRDVGDTYLNQTDLGDSVSAARNLQENHYRFEHQAKDMQDAVLRLVRHADHLLQATHYDEEGIRQRLKLIDECCENFMVRLDNRRKNLVLAANFFKMAQEAFIKLEQIENQLTQTDLPRNSAMLAEKHAFLSNTIGEVTTPVLRDGRILLERVSKDEPGADGVRRTVESLQQRCTALEEMCKEHTVVGEKSDAFIEFQEKFTSVHTWMVQVGQAVLNNSRDMGNNLYGANDFLEAHQQLEEDIRAKNRDVEALAEAVQDLVKAEDSDAPEAEEKLKSLQDNWSSLKALVDLRISLALKYVSYLKVAHQLTQHMDGVEDTLKSNRHYLQDISENIIKHVEEKWTSTLELYDGQDEKGKEFLDEAPKAEEDLKLESRKAVFNVETMITTFRDRKEHITNLMEVWQQSVTSGKEFKSEWAQFIQGARKTIDWVMKTEDELFPAIAGELGESNTSVEQYQKRLDEFEPTQKKAQEEIEQHLKTAEVLSLKGDTKGQKEMIVNELLKVHQRFQARINEYKILLNMTIQFFRNLHSLDTLIEQTEKEYQESELPTEVSKAELLLDHHIQNREQMNKIAQFISDEGEQIVVRVRQLDSEAVAKKDVESVLELAEDARKNWDKSWEDQKEKLEQNLQICQFNYDLRAIHYEVDDLNRQLQAKKGDHGYNLQNAKMISEAFKQFEMTIQVIEKKIENFISTAELMLKDKHYDSKHIRSEIDKLQNKWSTFHTSVHDYRDMLEVSVLFFQIVEECEEWARENSQFLFNIGRQAQDCKTAAEATELVDKLKSHLDEGQPPQEERISKLSELAAQLYGPQAQNRVRHVVVKYHDVMDSFKQANTQLENLQDALKKREEAPPPPPPEVSEPPVEEEITVKDVAPVAAVPIGFEPIKLPEERKLSPPKVIQPLKSADVMEGIRFTFECRFDSDDIPQLMWYKDNIPLVSPDYETRYDNGLATLTIEETFSEDTARYTCRATNAAGSVETSGHLTVRAAQKPQFTEDLQDVASVEGKPVCIQCRFTANPQPDVTWLRGSDPIIPSSVFKITIEPGFSSLEITEAYPEDTSPYTVVLHNPAGDASSNCNITIESTYETPTSESGASDAEASPPRFTQHLVDREVMEGGRARLDCIIVGHPEPEVIWYKHNKPVKESKDFQLLFEGDRCTLIIREAYLEDSGQYKCEARNPHGEAQSICELHVEPLSELSDAASVHSFTSEMAPPRFVMLMKDITCHEGERVQFNCRVTGQPQPTISWYRETVLLENSPDFQLTSDGELQTMSIPEAFAEDAGTFMVKAVNPGGEAKCYAKLTVAPTPEEIIHKTPVKTMMFTPAPREEFPLDHRPPEFTKLYMDKTVKSGDDVTLDCAIVGKPVPKVQWLFNGEPIRNKDYQIRQEGNKHSLYIPEVFDEDAGRFSITAENPSGRATCSAMLTVEAPAPPRPTHVSEGFLKPSAARKRPTPLDISKAQPTWKPKPIAPEAAPKFWAPVAPPSPLKMMKTPPVQAPPPRPMSPPIQAVSAPPAYAPVEPMWPKSPPVQAVKTPPAFLQQKKPPSFAQKSPPMQRREMPSYPQKSPPVQRREMPSYAQKSPPVQRREMPSYAQKSPPVQRREMPAVKSPPVQRRRTPVSSPPTPRKVPQSPPVYDHGMLTIGPDKPEMFKSTKDLTPKYKQIDVTVAVPVPPKFIEPLKNIAAEEGTRVVFEGVVTGSPEPTIKWFRESRQITEKPDFEISFRNNRVSLAIPEVFEEDAGKFTCKADNMAGSASSTAELIVKATMVPPSFPQRLQSKEIKEGQSVRLTVRVAGSPAPEVTWFREGAKIVSSPDFEIIQEGDIHTLYIPEVFYEDSGKFSVTAENQAGMAECTAELIVEVPSAREETASPTPPRSRDSSLGASPERRARAEIYRPIEDQRPLEERKWTFKVPSVSPERPPVVRKITPVHTAPVFTRPLQNTYVREGQRVIFECEVTGQPEPTIKWYHDNSEIKKSPDFNITFDHNTCRLVIAEVFAEDAGQYTCTAINPAGSKSTFCYLRVEPEPEKPPTPPMMRPVREPMMRPVREPMIRPAAAPRVEAPLNIQTPSFINKPVDSVLVEGSTASFTCRVAGNPMPEVCWLKNTAQMKEGNRNRMYFDPRSGNATLVLTQLIPEDQGEYSCVASNPVGEAIANAMLMPDEYYRRQEAPKPEKPKSILSELTTRLESPREKKQFFQTRAQRNLDRNIESRLADEPPKEVPVYRDLGGDKGDFMVSTFEDRLMKEIEFREARVRASESESESRSGMSGREYDSDFPDAGAAPTGPPSSPHIYQKLKDFRLIEGSDATFVCKVSGTPLPKVQWYKDGVYLRPSKRFMQTMNREGYATLRVRMALPEDAGHYTVLVMNNLGRDTCSGQLYIERLAPVEDSSFVAPETMTQLHALEASRTGKKPEGEGGIFEKHFKPQFRKIPDDATAREGTMCRFDSIVSGRPMPEFSWYRDGVQIHDDHLHKIVVNEEGIHSLIFNAVHKKDAGHYRCVARNRGGEDSFTVNLNVTERENVAPPRFVERLEPATVREGQPLTFACKAVGAPAPMMSWQREGKSLMSKPGYRVDTDGGYSSLTIDNVSKEDNAWFQCSAINIAGTASTRAKVNVVVEARKPEPERRLIIPKSTKPRPVPQPQPTVPEFASYVAPVETRPPPPEMPTFVSTIARDVGDAPPPRTLTPPRPEKPKEVEPSWKHVSLKHIELPPEPEYQEPSKMAPPTTPPTPGTMSTDLLIQPMPKFRPLEEAPRPIVSRVLQTDQPPERAGPVPQLSTYMAYVPPQLGPQPVEHVDRFQPPPEKVEPVQITTPVFRPADIMPRPLERSEEQLQLRPQQMAPESLPPWQTSVKHVAPVAPPEPEEAPVQIVAPVFKAAPQPVKPPTQLETQLLPRRFKALPEKEKSELEIRLQKRRDEAPKVSLQEYVLRHDEEVPDAKDMFDKVNQKPPKFKRDLTDVTMMESEPAHFETRLVPIGDPNMRIEWYKDGQLLRSGHRFRITYDFAYVALDLLWTYPEDNGEYYCKAINLVGEDTTNKATIDCKPKESIITETQLPESVHKISEMELRWAQTVPEPEVREPIRSEEAPSIEMKPEPVEVDEGESAKFIVKVGGHPRPRVTWWHNGSIIASGNRFILSYDGMIHYLEVPKTRDYDSGNIRVTAKNPLGEANASTDLKVRPKEDWRARLKKTPRKEFTPERFIQQKMELRTPELQEALSRQKTSVVELLKVERGIKLDDDTKKAEQSIHLTHSALLHTEPSYELRAHSPTLETTAEVHVERAKAKLQMEEVEKAEEESKRVQKLIQLERKEPPMFATRLQPQQVKEGKSVTMDVKFSGHPAPTVSWFREGFEIKPSRDFQITTTENSSSLHIPEAFPEDAGQYMIVLQNPHGKAHSKARLTVIEEVPEKEVPPEFRALLRDTRVMAGEPAPFDCQIISKPQPEVYWQKNGKRLDENPRWKFISEDEHYTFLIYEAVPEDAGSYECCAITPAGKTSCTAKLIVDVPPKVAEPPVKPEVKEVEKLPGETPKLLEPLKNLVVDEGTPAVFECKTTGKPPPVITWYLGPQVIKPSKYFKMTSQAGVHRLTITEAFPEDEGTYKCTAVNKAGEVTTTATLKVNTIESDIEPAGEPPRFLKAVAGLDLKEGMPAQFEVVVTGKPEPAIQWLREGEPIKPSPDFQMGKEGNKHILYVQEAFPEDSGIFTCRAINTSGKAECAAELYVEESRISPDRVEFEERQISLSELQQAQEREREEMRQPPEFIKALTPEKLLKAGQVAKLECLVNAYPMPSYTWYVNGMEITPSQKYRFLEEGNTVILLISPITPEDTGEYVLKVENPHGEASCRTSMTVQVDKPKEKPLDVTSVSKGQEPPKQMPTKPVFVKMLPKKIKAKEHGIAKLEVEVDAYPPPLIEWFVNGILIKPSPHYEMLHEAGKEVLLIIDVGPEDTGEYTCKVTSDLGTCVNTATLYVTDKKMPKSKSTSPTVEEKPIVTEKMIPPKFIVELVDQFPTDGDEVTMTCTVTGSPMPSISWFHNDRNITDSEDFQITFDIDTGVCKLIIIECFPEDRGTYRCIAVNPAGEAMTSCRIEIKETTLEPSSADEEITVQIVPHEHIPPKPTKEKVSVEVAFESVKTLLEPKEEAPPKKVEAKLPLAKEEVVVPVLQPVEEAGLVLDLSLLEGEEPEPEQQVTFVLQPPGEAKTIEQAEIIIEQPEPTTETVVHTITTEQDVTDLDITVHKKVITIESTDIPPTFIVPLQPRLAHDGEEVKMTCQVTGTPTPAIQWLKDDEELDSTDDMKLIFVPETGECTLHIPDAFPEDSGVFTIIATNPAGSAKCTANLIVQPPPPEGTTVTTTVVTKKETKVVREDEVVSQTTTVEKSPTFVKTPVPVLEVNEGDTVTLECQVDSEPKPDVSWFVNGLEIYPSAHIEVSEMNDICTLRINEATPEDSGEYVCKTENKLGEATCRTVLNVKPLEKRTLEVTPKTETTRETDFKEVTMEIAVDQIKREIAPVPEQQVTFEIPITEEKKVPDMPPEITRHLEPITAQDGDQVTFVVQAIGSPKPTFEWYHDSHLIHPSMDFQITVEIEQGWSTMVIVEVFPEDSGEYTCRAVNPVGEAFTTCTLNVISSEVEEVPQVTTTKEMYTESITIDQQQQLPSEVEMDLTFKKPKPQPQTATVAMETKPQLESLKMEVEVKEPERHVTEQTVMKPVPLVTEKQHREEIAFEIQPEEKPEEQMIPPEFTKPLENIKVMDGEEVKFRTTVTGYPMPEIVWYHNGRVVKPSPDFEIDYDMETGEITMYVAEVFPEDKGDYVCEATNPVGRAVTSCYLEVRAYEYRKDSQDEASGTSVSTTKEDDDEEVVSQMKFKLQQQPEEEDEIEKIKSQIQMEMVPETPLMIVGETTTEVKTQQITEMVIEGTTDQVEKKEIVLEFELPKEAGVESRVKPQMEEQTVQFTQEMSVEMTPEQLQQKEITFTIEKPTKKDVETRVLTQELEAPKQFTEEMTIQPKTETVEEKEVSFVIEIPKKTDVETRVLTQEELREEQVTEDFIDGPKPSAAAPTEISVELGKPQAKGKPAQRVETTVETKEVEEVISVEGVKGDEMSHKKVAVELQKSGIKQKQPTLVQAQMEVKEGEEVAQVQLVPTEETKPEEITVQLGKPMAKGKPAQRVETVVEMKEGEEIIQVALAPTEETKPEEVTVQLGKPTAKGKPAQRVETVVETKEGEEIVQVVLAPTEETKHEEVTFVLDKPTAKGKPAQRVETLVETKPEEEAISVEGVTGEEMSHKEISIELEKSAIKGKPETLVQFQLDVKEGEEVAQVQLVPTEETKPEEVTVQLGKPLAKGKPAQRVETLVETKEGEEIAQVQLVPTEEIQHEEVTLQLGKPTAKGKPALRVETVVETKEGEEIVQVALAPTEETKPEEVTFQLDMPTAKGKPAQRVETLVETKPEEEAISVEGVTGEEMSHKEISVELAKSAIKGKPETLVQFQLDVKEGEEVAHVELVPTEETKPEEVTVQLGKPLAKGKPAQRVETLVETKEGEEIVQVQLVPTEEIQHEEVTLQLGKPTAKGKPALRVETVVETKEGEEIVQVASAQTAETKPEEVTVQLGKPTAKGKPAHRVETVVETKEGEEIVQVVLAPTEETKLEEVTFELDKPTAKGKPAQRVETLVETKPEEEAISVEGVTGEEMSHKEISVELAKSAIKGKPETLVQFQLDVKEGEEVAQVQLVPTEETKPEEVTVQLGKPLAKGKPAQRVETLVETKEGEEIVQVALAPTEETKPEEVTVELDKPTAKGKPAQRVETLIETKEGEEIVQVVLAATEETKPEEVTVQLDKPTAKGKPAQRVETLVETKPEEEAISVEGVTGEEMSHKEISVELKKSAIKGKPEMLVQFQTEVKEGEEVAQVVLAPTEETTSEEITLQLDTSTAKGKPAQRVETVVETKPEEEVLAVEGVTGEEMSHKEITLELEKSATEGKPETLVQFQLEVKEGEEVAHVELVPTEESTQEEITVQLGKPMAKGKPAQRVETLIETKEGEEIAQVQLVATEETKPEEVTVQLGKPTAKGKPALRVETLVETKPEEEAISVEGVTGEEMSHKDVSVELKKSAVRGKPTTLVQTLTEVKEGEEVAKVQELPSEETKPEQVQVQLEKPTAKGKPAQRIEATVETKPVEEAISVEGVTGEEMKHQEISFELLKSDIEGKPTTLVQAQLEVKEGEEVSQVVDVTTEETKHEEITVELGKPTAKGKPSQLVQTQTEEKEGHEVAFVEAVPLEETKHEEISVELGKPTAKGKPAQRVETLVETKPEEEAISVEGVTGEEMSHKKISVELQKSATKGKPETLVQFQLEVKEGEEVSQVVELTTEESKPEEISVELGQPTAKGKPAQLVQTQLEVKEGEEVVHVEAVPSEETKPEEISVELGKPTSKGKPAQRVKVAVETKEEEEISQVESVPTEKTQHEEISVEFGKPQAKGKPAQRIEHIQEVLETEEVLAVEGLSGEEMKPGEVKVDLSKSKMGQKTMTRVESQMETMQEEEVGRSASPIKEETQQEEIKLELEKSTLKGRPTTRAEIQQETRGEEEAIPVVGVKGDETSHDEVKLELGKPAVSGKTVTRVHAMEEVKETEEISDVQKMPTEETEPTEVTFALEVSQKKGKPTVRIEPLTQVEEGEEVSGVQEIQTTEMSPEEITVDLGKIAVGGKQPMRVETLTEVKESEEALPVEGVTTDETQHEDRKVELSKSEIQKKPETRVLFSTEVKEGEEISTVEGISTEETKPEEISVQLKQHDVKGKPELRVQFMQEVKEGEEIQPKSEIVTEETKHEEVTVVLGAHDVQSKPTTLVQAVLEVAEEQEIAPVAELKPDETKHEEITVELGAPGVKGKPYMLVGAVEEAIEGQETAGVEALKPDETKHEEITVELGAPGVKGKPQMLVGAVEEAIEGQETAGVEALKPDETKHEEITVELGAPGVKGKPQMLVGAVEEAIEGQETAGVEALKPDETKHEEITVELGAPGVKGKPQMLVGAVEEAIEGQETAGVEALKPDETKHEEITVELGAPGVKGKPQMMVSTVTEGVESQQTVTVDVLKPDETKHEEVTVEFSASGVKPKPTQLVEAVLEIAEGETTLKVDELKPDATKQEEISVELSATAVKPKRETLVRTQEAALGPEETKPTDQEITEDFIQPADIVSQFEQARVQSAQEVMVKLQDSKVSPEDVIDTFAVQLQEAAAAPVDVKLTTAQVKQKKPTATKPREEETAEELCEEIVVSKDETVPVFSETATTLLEVAVKPKVETKEMHEASADLTIKRTETTEAEFVITPQKDVTVESTVSVELQAPRFTSELQDITVTDGSEVTFEVALSGEPRPTVNWYVNGIEIQPSKEYDLTYTEHTSQLVIHDVVVEDEGTYTVKLTNDAGSCETSCFMKVIPRELQTTTIELTQKDVRESFKQVEVDIEVESPKKAPEEVPKPEDLPGKGPVAPLFITPLQQQTVYETQPVTFECRVTGRPEPQITWYKDNKKVKSTKDVVLKYEKGICQLFIPHAGRPDEAEYKCEAKNKAGKVSTWAQLFVEKLLDSVSRIVREEVYEYEVTIDINWTKKDTPEIITKAVKPKKRVRFADVPIYLGQEEYETDV